MTWDELTDREQDACLVLAEAETVEMGRRSRFNQLAVRYSRKSVAAIRDAWARLFIKRYPREELP